MQLQWFSLRALQSWTRKLIWFSVLIFGPDIDRDGPQKSPCHTSLCLPALVPGCSSHQVQDTDACIKNNHRRSTLLLPLTYDNLHPLQKPEICEWETPRGAITEMHKITFQNFFIHRSWQVEWTSHPIQNDESLTIFKQQLKTHLFCLHLTSASSSS